MVEAREQRRREVARSGVWQHGQQHRDKDGSGQRLIPRYAVLKPVEGWTPPVETATAKQLDEARVVAAFDAFYGNCLHLVDDFSKPALLAARQTFLEAIGAQK